MASTRALFRLPGGLGRTRALLCAGVAAVAMASLLPLRFPAVADLAFESGAAPPPAIVRGVGQVLASRDMAREVVRRLDADDVARLAGGWSLITGRAEAAAGSEAEAARRILRDLDVRPVQNGRGLAITVTAGTPARAARVADAYVAAFLALDGAARADAAPGTGLPPLKAGGPAVGRLLPEPPRPFGLFLIAAAGLAVWIGRRRSRHRAARQAEVAEVPVELAPSQRVLWLDRGTATGLAAETAVQHLLRHLDAPRGRLVLVSADASAADGAADLAIALARHLAEEKRVALVALDAAAALGDLVADPRASGIGELVSGVARFAEALHRDAASHAHVIPPGRDRRALSGLLASERLPAVLDALRRTYDHVIVAAPPLAGVGGLAGLAALDPLVVCAEPDGAPATAAVESCDALVAAGFCGVVMLRLADGTAAPEAPEEMVPSLDAQALKVIASPRIPVQPDDWLEARWAGAA